MSLFLEPAPTERVPLTRNEQGAVLVEGTRVPLDLVVAAFNEGQSAEEIVLAYPTLPLASVYAVFAFYLRHRDEVDSYAAQRRQEAEALRAQIEADPVTQRIRERILAQRPSR